MAYMVTLNRKAGSKTEEVLVNMDHVAHIFEFSNTVSGTACLVFSDGSKIAVIESIEDIKGKLEKYA